MSDKRIVCSLYKSILRLHRGLPPELQLLGTNYVRDEFRRHKVSDSATAKIFISEWTEYALGLAYQLGLKGPKSASKLGQHMTETELDKMREDQIAQLYELMKSAKESPTQERM